MNKKGFTLLETMIVLAIIAVLLSILSEGIPFLREKTRDSRRIYELDNLRRQIELYKNENGSYPATSAGAGSYYSFFTIADAYSAAAPAPTQITPTYVPGLVPNYFASLPVDPNPGASAIPACAAVGMDKNIAYFSNGDHYKIVYNCASETFDYDPNSEYFDPGCPTCAWAASDDMNYATWTMGWN